MIDDAVYTFIGQRDFQLAAEEIINQPSGVTDRALDKELMRGVEVKAVQRICPGQPGDIQ